MRPIQTNVVNRVLTSRISRRSAIRRVGGSGLAAAAIGGFNYRPGLAAIRPSTQADTTSAFAYKLEASAPLEFTGGLARIATSTEFPALTGMAIRSEELDPGALQAPHWHPNAGEVHYVMAGRGTAGVISPGGEHAIFEVRPGSVSFFPKGHYHYVHNSGDEPLKVLAAFTHEAPSQFAAGDVVDIVPTPILAQVLGVAAADFPELPASENRTVVVLGGPVEAPATDPAATEPDPYTLNLESLKPAEYEGGTVTNVRGKEFARLDGISFLPLYVETGGVREPHWHPNAAELIYLKSGEAEIGLIGPEVRETFRIGPGDIAFFPTNWFHYVASIGSEAMDSIVYLSHATPARIDLSDAVGHFPHAVSAVSLGLDATAFDALPQRTGVVVAAASDG